MIQTLTILYVLLVPLIALCLGIFNLIEEITVSAAVENLSAAVAALSTKVDEEIAKRQAAEATAADLEAKLAAAPSEDAVAAAAAAVDAATAKLSA